MSGEMMTIAPLLTVVFGAVAVLIADMLVPARRLTPITAAPSSHSVIWRAAPVLSLFDL